MIIEVLQHLIKNSCTNKDGILMKRNLGLKIKNGDKPDCLSVGGDSKFVDKSVIFSGESSEIASDILSSFISDSAA